MKNSWIVALFAAASLPASEFTLQIGNPVAVQTQTAKAASFAFRAVGCEQMAKLDVTATAEGTVGGERKSQKIPKLVPGTAPGTFLVYRHWPLDGVWILHLVARCGEEKAGALVAVGPQGVLREHTKHFSRAATESEIRSSLHALTEKR
ncbi:MAG: hypothetical protein HY820_27760 [Acidobacteria bacterium]|nr:hypothetical protein [Acidobacteriota bacterium]